MNREEILQKMRAACDAEMARCYRESDTYSSDKRICAGVAVALLEEQSKRVKRYLPEEPICLHCGRTEECDAKCPDGVTPMCQMDPDYNRLVELYHQRTPTHVADALTKRADAADALIDFLRHGSGDETCSRLVKEWEAAKDNFRYGT